MPDLAARVSILKAVLRKSPVADSVDMDLLARSTDKFTGADLTEICQRAAKFAIRRNIEADIKRSRELADLGEEAEEEEYVDPVPEILPQHFNMAMQGARRSVSDADLAKYSGFAMRMHQERGSMGTNVSNFRMPEGGSANAGANAAAAAAEADDDEEEDDLYS